MLTDQWFVDTAAQRCARWNRENIQAKRHIITAIEPWCISRQLCVGPSGAVWFDEKEINTAPQPTRQAPGKTNRVRCF